MTLAVPLVSSHLTALNRQATNCGAREACRSSPATDRRHRAGGPLSGVLEDDVMTSHVDLGYGRCMTELLKSCGTAILILGVVGPIYGITTPIAWIWGNSEIKEIEARNTRPDR